MGADHVYVDTCSAYWINFVDQIDTGTLQVLVVKVYTAVM